MSFIDTLIAFAVLGLPGPFLLALLLPRHFAPQASRLAGIGLYGGAWAAAQAWVYLSSAPI
jgi:hypothetical protein